MGRSLLARDYDSKAFSEDKLGNGVSLVTGSDVSGKLKYPSDYDMGMNLDGGNIFQGETSQGFKWHFKYI